MSAVGCTVSSSPLRGAATWSRNRRRGSGSACHHRPYEGQQPASYVSAVVEAVGVIIAPTRGSNGFWAADVIEAASSSSSPLRGAATRSGGGSPSRRRPRHHRPYEGQQPDHRDRGPAGFRRSSSPLRGAATSPSVPHQARAARHHRPYEGQQPIEGLASAEDAESHHRPYEGQQPEHDLPAVRHQRAGHHRPYEGQQRAVAAAGGAGGPGSSSPLRGAATRDGSGSPLIVLVMVIIAPTRGSNVRMVEGREPGDLVIIAPTRGSNIGAARGQGR